MDELIVFLMREFGWTLEYTVNLVRTLPVRKLNALIAETKYQKEVDEYSLKAAIFNIVTNPHTKHPKSGREIIGNPPQQKGESGKQGLEKAAQEQGIIMPKGGQYDQ